MVLSRAMPLRAFVTVSRARVFASADLVLEAHERRRIECLACLGHPPAPR